MSERKRYVSNCSPEHECSSEEINCVLEELRDVMSDSGIVVYDEPTVEEMEYILAVALDYTGEWYHSRVSLREYVFVSVLHSKLQKQVMELGTDHGIFLSYVLDVLDEDEVALNKLLDSAFDGDVR